MKRTFFALLEIISLLIVALSTIPRAQPQTGSLLQGVWDNFDFSRPAQDWVQAAQRFGGSNALIDLVVALASSNDTVLLPFPFEHSGYFESYVSSDLVEPYLDVFDAANMKVILSVQPLKANVTQLIDILLSRYSHHPSIIGINVDMEWKETGTPTYVSNQERDTWSSAIRSVKSSYKLFLTYFDGTHFPDDAPDLIVLFDGERDAQTNLLEQYRNITDHYGSVGLYTGYASSAPPSASSTRILTAVPKTQFIIHTSDAFSEKLTLIFEMDNVQVDWNERLTINLLDLHLKKSMPLLCGVIPYGLDNPDLGEGFLPSYLRDLHQNYFDIFEVAQLGYTNDGTDDLAGRNYQDQKTIMEKGLSIMKSTGINPVTFVPSDGSADETTLQVAEDLKFGNFVDLFENLTSDKLLILDSWVSLTETVGNDTVLKSPEQLMTEVNQRFDEGVITILYHVEDFAVNSKMKLAALSNLIDALRNNDEYFFMTARQYKETIEGESAPSEPSEPPPFPTWGLYLGVGGSLTLILAALLVRKRRKPGKSEIDKDES